MRAKLEDRIDTLGLRALGDGSSLGPTRRRDNAAAAKNTRSFGPFGYGPSATRVRRRRRGAPARPRMAAVGERSASDWRSAEGRRTSTRCDAPVRLIRPWLVRGCRRRTPPKDADSSRRGRRLRCRPAVSNRGRGASAGVGPRPGPALVDLLAVGLGRARLRAVVALDRPVPRSRLVVQGAQKSRSVGDVGRGIERLLQAGERVRVMHQVDLHAADVDAPPPGPPQPLDPADGLGLGVEVAAVAGVVRRPGPGPDGPAARGRAGRNSLSATAVSRPRGSGPAASTRGSRRRTVASSPAVAASPAPRATRSASRSRSRAKVRRTSPHRAGAERAARRCAVLVNGALALRRLTRPGRAAAGSGSGPARVPCGQRRRQLAQRLLDGVEARVRDVGGSSMNRPRRSSSWRAWTRASGRPCRPVM